jgi:hypothetical protein
MLAVAVEAVIRVVWAVLAAAEGLVDITTPAILRLEPLIPVVVAEVLQTVEHPALAAQAS